MITNTTLFTCGNNGNNKRSATRRLRESVHYRAGTSWTRPRPNSRASLVVDCALRRHIAAAHIQLRDLTFTVNASFTTFLFAPVIVYRSRCSGRCEHRLDK